MVDLKKLKDNAKDLTVLYVEDNDKLRANASKFLKKFFNTVYVAEDGKVGLSIFKDKHIDIVITDIKMPNMDGMELAKNIKKINSDTKVIIMSAFDDNEYLYNSIELGIFRYLKKPVNVTSFAEVLYSCTQDIKKTQDSFLFLKNIENVFNYQASMVVMIQDSKAIFANQMFLNYFEVENIEEFLNKFDDFGNIFLKHDGFLYNKADKSWYDQLISNPNTLYNTKLKDKNENIKHFILKYKIIPGKESYGILSFDDVTELNLLKLFDEKTTKYDEKVQDSKELFKFLNIIHRNNAKMEIHNYYKGLSITNEAVISELSEDSVTIKTKFLQQKAIQIAGQTLLASDAFPFTIECLKVTNISFENQSVTLKNLHFVKNSPIKRKTVRVVPEEKHSASIFMGENKLHTEIVIEDISLDAVKLSLELCPPHLEEGSEVTLDIVLELDNKPLIINTLAVLFKKIELKYNFNLIFLFEDFNKNGLVKYITKRQMAIIREFKGIQNG